MWETPELLAWRRISRYQINSTRKDLPSIMPHIYSGSFKLDQIGEKHILTKDVGSEIPSNLVLKKLSPKLWLPLLAVIWGIITMCLGFVRGYASFIAVRALLGLAEGGLVPGMILYLSSLYHREELALRIGIFYTAASLSGAFGGLYTPKTKDRCTKLTPM